MQKFGWFFFFPIGSWNERFHFLQKQVLAFPTAGESQMSKPPWIFLAEILCEADSDCLGVGVWTRVYVCVFAVVGDEIFQNRTT